MQQGWIKLHRKVRENWLYQEDRVFSKFEAWMDILMRANHEDTKIVLGNELITVKRGQFITSELKLMDSWKWGKSKTRSFLELLEKDGMIVKKSDRKKTTITICNYNVYHDKENKNRPQSDHEQTDNRPSSDTEKNVKNEKNDKEVYTSKIKDLLSHFSTIENFNSLSKKYWDVIRETRTHGKIKESVIYRNMDKWTKYDSSVVEYALKEHIKNHRGKKEEYTIGIMRGAENEGIPTNKEKTNEWGDF